MILGTIEKSRGLQTPEMLEQLKLRWISKLNDLCLGVTKDEKSDRAQEWVPTELEVAAPKLDGVYPVKVEYSPVVHGNGGGDYYHYYNDYSQNNGHLRADSSDFGTARGGVSSKKRAGERSSLQDIPIPIISSKEMRNVNEMNTEYELCKMATKRPNLENAEEGRRETASHHDKDACILPSPPETKDDNENSSSKLGAGQCDADEFEDDEFGDASWDIVASNEGNSTKSGGQADSSSSGQGKPSCKGTDGNQGDSDFDGELLSDQGSDLENVSDLDDEEPECNDVIIGHFEKVIRPYTRKKNQKGKWKVKLRNGIAQIANQEIPFETLIGEFEF